MKDFQQPVIQEVRNAVLINSAQLVETARVRTLADHCTHSASLQALQRVLYMWAIRHPASGYVQGINDLVTPIIVVFLTALLGTLGWAASDAINRIAGLI